MYGGAATAAPKRFRDSHSLRSRPSFKSRRSAKVRRISRKTPRRAELREFFATRKPANFALALLSSSCPHCVEYRKTLQKDEKRGTLPFPVVEYTDVASATLADTIAAVANTVDDVAAAALHKTAAAVRRNRMVPYTVHFSRDKSGHASVVAWTGADRHGLKTLASGAF